MFSQDDVAKIRQRGSDLELVYNQLERFKQGFPFTEIVAPASVDNGIIAFSDQEKTSLANYFDQQKESFDICRFIPASGAATRMFKDLFTIREKLQGMSNEEQLKHIRSDAEAKMFFNSINSFPFYADMPVKEDVSPSEILDALLTDEGLNYGNLPKGLIKFHKYKEGNRTAFEEHLYEAARIIGPGKKVKLHFTVSEEHLMGFQSLEKKIIPDLERKIGVDFELTYSFQKSATDTIAVDMKNNPFRDENGAIVFRPGGHGALIENLNDLTNEIIFINNIDNVSPDRNSKLRLLNKKVLGGMLLKSLDELNELHKNIVSDDDLAIENAFSWLKNKAKVEIPEEVNTWNYESKKQWALKYLDKPLRVCGMVKNTGEPGGGPFFIRNQQGLVSLQIVEPSQIDTKDQQQSTLFKQSSHFNPVDIVCCVKKRDGGTYHLSEYVDHTKGFISLKSVKGKDLKALELPGLWNGSMEGWITLFVEIPAETFTPVKTVFDLIKPEHE
ncbi:DUF4301 family protein [Bacteroidota bacterium]